MKKIITIFLALIVTTTLWAQRFKVGDLYYKITNNVKPYTVEVVGCVPDVVSAEIPATISLNSTAFLEAPGAGKVTICVQVPEPLCDGSFVVIPGSLTSWGTGYALEYGQATQLVEETNNFYAATFDWHPDCAFKVAHCKADGTWDWSYQAASGAVLEGDVTPNNDITQVMVINSDNQVIYIIVDSWEKNACEKQNDFGTATFNLTAVGFAPEAKFAIAGSGLAAGAWACPPPEEHEMKKVADGKYTLTLDVPATFQYKYLVDKAGDGTWEWYSANTYNMPVDLVTNDTEEFNDGWYVNSKNNTALSDNDNNFTVTYAVTSIRESAFANSPITSVTIPNSIKRIGYGAFEHCQNLTTTFHTGDLASWCEIDFEGWCSNPMQHTHNLYLNIPGTSFAEEVKGDIVIPNTVDTIHNYAFAGATSFTSVTIPNSVASIGNSAFRGCSSLTSITIPSSVTSIGYAAFVSCSRLTSITIPNSVTSIGDEAFGECSSLTSITIPNSVTYIGEATFYDCSSLEYLSIPNSVKFSEVYEENDYIWTEYYYGFTCLYECYNLKTLIVPADFFGVDLEDYYEGDFMEEFAYLPRQLESLTINGGNMTHPFGWDFMTQNRKSLKHIDFGATESIAEEAFNNFYNLESLVLPSQLETIPYMAVAECVKLKSISIPATVVEIEDRAFENCRMLSSVAFAENGALTRIGNWAFYNNHELTNLVIPEGVTEVGHAAFYGCTYLKEMTLPSTVQNIADNGFALCAKLQRMNVDALVPPTVAARTFEEVDRSIPVYVPDEVVPAYQAAPVWQEFNIQGKSNAPAAIDNILSPTTNCQKLLRDGQLIILRDGVEYNALGQEL